MRSKAEGEGKTRCGKPRLAALYHHAGDIRLLTFRKISKPCPDVDSSADCGPAPENPQQSLQCVHDEDMLCDSSA